VGRFVTRVDARATRPPSQVKSIQKYS